MSSVCFLPCAVAGVTSSRLGQSFDKPATTFSKPSPNVAKSSGGFFYRPLTRSMTSERAFQVIPRLEFSVNVSASATDSPVKSAQSSTQQQTYHYVLGTESYLVHGDQEPLFEILDERRAYYKRKNLDLDFWLVVDPAFLKAPEFADQRKRVPGKPAAVISTNESFITFLKLRLEYVEKGKFVAPSPSIPDAIASL
mmetsp:Transcript_1443/g.2711  ORF Transcript_1443/g.2711 Transcript_1443/m.2711 type:complete len:196 (-) Transcript_1443:707-1294(-)|eukprot:CAMPEP_0196663536 /NCGR_PEP_ID=MMETSP1086-20130531/53282_1 /TAXON_ID=77921 /ORGANISM="Cyanoptyche  gloeocystis , Strain SAG4.97" /LENGTH=195 /DNA_ID=CAMNT_0041999393 /DNA_START=78 /DNA_END=665 /DNA_ORIENTATION=-